MIVELTSENLLETNEFRRAEAHPILDGEEICLFLICRRCEQRGYRMVLFIHIYCFAESRTKCSL